MEETRIGNILGPSGLGPAVSDDNNGADDQDEGIFDDEIVGAEDSDNERYYNESTEQDESNLSTDNNDHAAYPTAEAPRGEGNSNNAPPADLLVEAPREEGNNGPLEDLPAEIPRNEEGTDDPLDDLLVETPQDEEDNNDPHADLLAKMPRGEEGTPSVPHIESAAAQAIQSLSSRPEHRHQSSTSRLEHHQQSSPNRPEQTTCEQDIPSVSHVESSANPSHAEQTSASYEEEIASVSHIESVADDDEQSSSSHVESAEDEARDDEQYGHWQLPPVSDDELAANFELQMLVFFHPPGGVYDAHDLLMIDEGFNPNVLYIGHLYDLLEIRTGPGASIVEDVADKMMRAMRDAVDYQWDLPYGRGSMMKTIFGAASVWMRAHVQSTERRDINVLRVLVGVQYPLAVLWFTRDMELGLRLPDEIVFVIGQISMAMLGTGYMYQPPAVQRPVPCACLVCMVERLARRQRVLGGRTPALPAQLVGPEASSLAHSATARSAPSASGAADPPEAAPSEAAAGREAPIALHGRSRSTVTVDTEDSNVRSIIPSTNSSEGGGVLRNARMMFQRNCLRHDPPPDDPSTMGGRARVQTGGDGDEDCCWCCGCGCGCNHECAIM